jgi:hypothetical protein
MPRKEKSCICVSEGLALLRLQQWEPSASSAEWLLPKRRRPFTAHQLKPNVYWIEGGGGNSGVIAGDKGVIVVDAPRRLQRARKNIWITSPKSRQSRSPLLSSRTATAITSMGWPRSPRASRLIAHENNKKEQQAVLTAGGRGPPPADHLPAQVVSKKRENLKTDGVKLELLHWGPAHTSGDLVVYLPDEKIVFTGDIIATQLPDPLIHLEKNGSSEGWITHTKGIAALNSDQFVPGHGDVQTKAAIQKRLADAEAKRAKIKDLVAQAKSLDEIKAAVGDPPPGPRPNWWPKGSELSQLYRGGIQGAYDKRCLRNSDSSATQPN